MNPVRLLILLTFVPLVLMAWAIARWVHGWRSSNQSGPRHAATLVSVVTLLASCAIYLLVLIAPRLVGIVGHEPHFGPFFLGAVAAVLGGVVAVFGVERVRALLAVGAGVLLVEWFVLLDG